LSFSENLTIIFFIFETIQGDINTDVHRYSFKVAVNFIRFKKNYFFSRHILENYLKNFMKTDSKVAQFFHADKQADGQTDTHNDANCPLTRFSEHT
jgi:hypothetical protein